MQLLTKPSPGAQIAYCGHCERLMLAAIEASKAYHNLMGNLETAHIRRDAGQTFAIKQRVAMALKDRDSAIQALNHHERSHLAS